MKRKIVGILVSTLLIATAFLAMTSTMAAIGDDYFLYSKFDPAGISDVVGVGGWIKDYGTSSWGDEEQYVYFLSDGYGYKVKVWLTDYNDIGVDPTSPGWIEPHQHPENPYVTGPIEPRHFSLISSQYLRPYATGAHTEEFYVDASGVYVGAYPTGIYKWDHSWTYQGKIANSPPERTESMAYDADNDVWYAGGRDRKIYELSDTDIDGDFLDETWVHIFTYPTYGGGHHDGMEYVNGYLWISDMTSDVIGQWEYDTGTSLWMEKNRFIYTEVASVEGMGFGPNDHFWAGSGWGSSSYLYEFGGGELQQELLVFDKTMSASEGELGDVITVTINVNNPNGYTMTVEDHLPTFLKYVPGTFLVDTVPVTPTVADGVISTVVGGGDHVITFDVQIIQVEAAEYGEDNWAYLIYNDETVAEDSVWVNTYPYDGFFKRACLIWNEPGDEYIDLNEDVHWLFEITVENTYDYTITNVVVTDRLAAELEIDEVKYVSKGTFTHTTKGNVKMTWTIDDLTPGEEARLVLEISTKMGKKWQEYTSPGTYEINSGAVFKFIGLNDFQHSAHTGQIVFDVPGEWPHVPGTEYCTIYIKYLPEDSAKLITALGLDYYFDFTLWNIPGGYDICDGVWPGWCADAHIYITLGTTYDTTFYSSYDENLPASASDDEQWDYINYILNNKQGNAADDVQSAIWYFADADYPMPTDPEAAAMVNDALANGAGFVPEPGDVMAVICYISPDIQLVFIEVDP